MCVQILNFFFAQLDYTICWSFLIHDVWSQHFPQQFFNWPRLQIANRVILCDTLNAQRLVLILINVLIFVVATSSVYVPSWNMNVITSSTTLIQTDWDHFLVFSLSLFLSFSLSYTVRIQFMQHTYDSHCSEMGTIETLYRTSFSIFHLTKYLPAICFIAYE